MKTVQKSAINFPVEMVSSESITGIMANSAYSHFVIGNIDGEKRLINACSKNYGLLPLNEVITRIETMLNGFDLIYTPIFKANDEKSVFQLKYVIKEQILRDSNGNEVGHNDLGFTVGNNLDKVYYSVDIITSYNGLTKYSIRLGLWRLVCSNGLVIPFEGKEAERLNLTFSGKHTTLFLERMEIVFQSIAESLESFIDTDIMKRFDILTNNVSGNWIDRLEAAMDANGISIGKTLKTGENSKKVLNEIAATVRSESASLDMPVNDWLIYNGINAYLATKKASPEVTQKKDSEVMSYLLATAN